MILITKRKYGKAQYISSSVMASLKSKPIAVTPFVLLDFDT
jgi:hypothetical protein